MSKSINDRRGFLKNLKTPAENDRISLDLGCGTKKFSPSFIGIDLSENTEVDIIGDVFDILDEIPDSTISQIYSSHFFEHIEDIPRLLRECMRVMKSGGNMDIIVPHHSNPFFYSDPTHKSFYGLYTFAYYAECGILKRGVPAYSRINGLQISNIELIFKSYRPHYIRHGLKKAIEKFVNLSNFNKEFYEEMASGFISCYEIRTSLIIRKSK